MGMKTGWTAKPLADRHLRNMFVFKSQSVRHRRIQGVPARRIPVDHLPGRHRNTQ